MHHFQVSLLNVQRYVQVTPVQIDLVGFQKWLSGKNVQSAELRAEYLFSKLDTDASGFVDVPEYVSKRVLDAGEFLCHAPEDVSSEPIAFPGCPCNAIESPALGACPAGRCPSVPNFTFLCTLTYHR